MVEKKYNYPTKRISVALPIEVYNGVRALASISADNITDYVAGVLAEQVAKNQTVVQQVQLARQAYQDTLAMAKSAEDSKKAD
jgi:hypothetical protein